MEENRISGAPASLSETPASILRLVLTPRCNLRCIYCHNEGFEPDQKDFEIVSMPELRRMLLKLREHGVRSICLTGGDPLVSEFFSDVVQIACEVVEGPNVHLSTNGVALERYLDLISLLDLGRINVSCDAVDVKTYHRVTGRNYFDTVVHNIEKAVAKNFFVNVNCVLLSGINTKREYIESMLSFWESKGVRLSFLRLCFSQGQMGKYKYDMNHLIEFLDKAGFTSYLIRHHNRPPNLCYRYGGMEVALRYHVPDRSTPPCATCWKRSECSEGLYHPRLGMNGILRTCVLRKDLNLDLKLDSLSEDTLFQFLHAFDLNPSRWIAASADSP